jgi:hypothetical protein
MSKLPGELTPYTFKDTGISIKIRKVNPLLVNELDKAFPAPKPPMQEVDYGDGNKVMEANEAHPDYIQALSDYRNARMDRYKKLLVKRGVECKVDLEAVEELKKTWKEDYGCDMEGTDKEIYIFYICAGTQEDMDELMDAILKRSQPTKEAVELAKVSFPG